MSITSQLKTIAAAISGINFRNTIMADALLFETEINRIGAEVDPVISPLGAITLGGVQRTTWPAAGGTASAFNDVLQNGSVGNLPAAASSFQVNDTSGTSLFSVDKTTGNVTIKGAITAVGGVMPVYALDTGAANAYVIALTPVIAAYARSFQGTFKAANANTGASTINAGGGVIPLVNDIGGALAANDILAGDNIEFQYSVTDNKAYITSTIQSQNDARYFQLSAMDPQLFYKTNALVPAFTKTAAATISINAGVSVIVAGLKLYFAAATAIVMPPLTAGTDYAIYACTDGTIRADSSFVYPTGYTALTSRLIGGFHYSLTAPATTLAGGSFATTGNGKIWVQGDVDLIAGINSYSIWDLKFRPKCDPRGMALVGNQVWLDIYLCNTNTATNGTSKAGTNIASGTVLPIIPAVFNGNGSTTYPSLNWWVANELARSNGKRLPWEHEFVDAAFGVTENQTIDATASTYSTTLRNAGYTSRYGIEQASGHQWIWGQDSNAYSDITGAYSWKDVNGNTGTTGSGRGQIFTAGTYGLVRVILGGSRAISTSGSRASYWGSIPWNSNWAVGLRAACDHMISL